LDAVNLPLADRGDSGGIIAQYSSFSNPASKISVAAANIPYDSAFYNITPSLQAELKLTSYSEASIIF